MSSRTGQSGSRNAYMLMYVRRKPLSMGARQSEISLISPSTAVISLSASSASFYSSSSATSLSALLPSSSPEPSVLPSTEQPAPNFDAEASLLSLPSDLRVRISESNDLFAESRSQYVVRPARNCTADIVASC